MSSFSVMHYFICCIVFIVIAGEFLSCFYSFVDYEFIYMLVYEFLSLTRFFIIFLLSCAIVFRFRFFYFKTDHFKDICTP